MSDANPCEQLRAALEDIIDCEECQDAAALFDSGEIEGVSSPQRLLLLAHARGCPDCADALEAERHLRGLVRSCLAEAGPSDLEDRILTRLSAMPEGAGAESFQ
ncbi:MULTISPECIES: anti-sigma factor [Schaalia]|uniref:anti-sigma factor n=1 Tax=Schaalia TaxID=2529408 RepID=UPI002A823BE3|nr:anti-sigma factor [Schaalia hyovaginalis]MDY4493048.1 anti-sigma factor [Schaalia hyovaginalis]